MAAKTRKQAVDIERDILRDGPRYSFVQALRLLERKLSRETGAAMDGETLERRLRVRPELSLSYPESDISRIDLIPGNPDRYVIEATFLGLYGASSPLPTFYTEDLLHERSDDRSVARDFLDILNAPLYFLYYRIWSRYRLLHRVVERPDPDMMLRLFALAGLSGDQLRNQAEDPYGLLRYAGLTTLFPRSAESLRSLLADRFEEPTLRIEQCVLRTCPVPEEQRCTLGRSGCRLGEDAILGAEIADRMGKIRILLGPAGADTLHRFLPDGPEFAEMRRLIRFASDQPMAWDAEIALRPSEVHPAVLGGEQWSRLGWNTWAFSGELPGDRAVVTVEGVA